MLLYYGNKSFSNNFDKIGSKLDLYDSASSADLPDF